MSKISFEPIFLANDKATELIGQDIAMALQKGDCLCLYGDLGAGKSTLARSIIRCLANDIELDVPSPTFTLVQNYDARLNSAHFDLYRLSHSDELEELGLDDALENGIALIEWPQNGAGELPPNTIDIHLDLQGEGRSLVLDVPLSFEKRFRRTFEIREFLENSGLGKSNRHFFFGDASARRYEEIDEGNSVTILMDSPPLESGPIIENGKTYAQIVHTAHNVVPFIAIAKALRENEFCAPQIYSCDINSGLVTLEHLGSEPFLNENGEPILDRYCQSAKILAQLHQVNWQCKMPADDEHLHILPRFDVEAMMTEINLLANWYIPYVEGKEANPKTVEAFQTAWQQILASLEKCENSLLLRDFHSPNIIWREEFSGRDQIGIIDFQDAMFGPCAYDVASLCLDARVSVSSEIEIATRNAYCVERHRLGEFDQNSFERAYAIMAAQRNSKILGIFVRLDQRDGKSTYLQHLPRIRDYLSRVIGHEALTPIREIYKKLGIG